MDHRRWQPDLDLGAVVPASTAISRGPEHRIAALTLAALTFLAGLIGTAHLFVEGTLHERSLDRAGEAVESGGEGHGKLLSPWTVVTGC